ncbi:MAG: S-layer homology domain-containing protein [Evtepia gabavorous]
MRQENLTTGNVFADAGAGDWYNTAISTMAELGILKGRTPDTLRPQCPYRPGGIRGHLCPV